MNREETWTKTLEDGRKVIYAYRELTPNQFEITAIVEGDDESFQAMKKHGSLPQSHEEVEKQFAPENFKPKP